MICDFPEKFTDPAKLYKIPGQLMPMENMTFETDSNVFRCVECDERIKVEIVEKEPRQIGCEKCGVEYLVAQNGDGMTVEVLTKSEPELTEEEEKNLEENDE